MSEANIKAADGLNGVGAIALVNNIKLLPPLNLSAIALKDDSAGESAPTFGSDVMIAVGKLECIGSVSLVDKSECSQASPLRVS